MDARRFAPATLRNRQHILAVLRRVLPAEGRVLEIASGSGEHAVFFADAMPGLTWLPSDPDPANLASIRAWTLESGVANVADPLHLDVTRQPWPVSAADAVVCINMIHIAPWDAAIGLLRGAGFILPPSAPLYLYGPFSQDGQMAPSNQTFDASLRAQDPRWGVRDLADVTRAAGECGLVLDGVVEMPANNLSVVFRRA